MVHRRERYRQPIEDLNDRRRYQEMRRGTQRPGRSREKKSMPLLLTTQVYKNKIKRAQVELTVASVDAKLSITFRKGTFHN